MRFDRFTEYSQDAAARSYEITQRYKHTMVDNEHLFLALLEQNDGSVPKIMDILKVDTTVIQEQFHNYLRRLRQYGPKGSDVGQIYYTPRIRVALEQSQLYASHFKDEQISTEHILLGILSEEDRNTSAVRISEEFDCRVHKM